MSSPKMKDNSLIEHQAAMYEILVEFDRVCKILGVQYILFAGTMLGAVRHEGFIPWDDDLDVAMLREDYEKFLNNANFELNKDNFYLQKEFSEHWPMFYSKLRMNNTTCLEKYHPKDKECHQGVFIDIFPCDNAYSNMFLRKIQFYSSKIVIAKSLNKRGYDTDSYIKKIFIFLCKVIPMNLFFRIAKSEKRKGDLVHSFFGGSSKMEKSVYKKSYFTETRQKKFVKKDFPIPKQYEDVLRTMYRNYMELPPESERECKKHTLLLDLNNSYEKYIDYRDGLKFDIYTRSIR